MKEDEPGKIIRRMAVAAALSLAALTLPQDTPSALNQRPADVFSPDTRPLITSEVVRTQLEPGDLKYFRQTLDSILGTGSDPSLRRLIMAVTSPEDNQAKILLKFNENYESYYKNPTATPDVYIRGFFRLEVPNSKAPYLMPGIELSYRRSLDGKLQHDQTDIWLGPDKAMREPVGELPQFTVKTTRDLATSALRLPPRLWRDSAGGAQMGTADTPLFHYQYWAFSDGNIRTLRTPQQISEL